MKIVLFAVSFFLFLLVGCNEQNSILEPELDYTQNSISKGRPILVDNSDKKVIAEDFDIIIDEDNNLGDFVIYSDTKGRPILLDNSKKLILSENLDDIIILNNDTEDLTLQSSLSKVDVGELESRTTLKNDPLNRTIYSRNYTVNSKKGAVIFINKLINQSTGKPIFVRVQLIIPKYAFEGILTFNIEINADDLSVKLSPTPYTFDKPLALSMMFYDVDLQGYSESDFDFDYLDGEPENLRYILKDVDITRGTLLVIGAEIHHFSRYGWTRTR